MSMWRYLGQAAAYGAFIAVLGLLAPGPAYQHLAPGLATIKLSLRHAGARVADCRDRSAEELAQLPENMRAPQVCGRERSPLLLQLSLDDVPVFSETMRPRGLRGDGRASMYRRLTVPAGDVHVSVRLKDDVRAKGFQYQRSEVVTLAPAEVLVIDFDEKAGTFEFRTATPTATPAAHPAEAAG